VHDYKLFKDQFDQQKEWFKEKQLIVDLGFQGIQNDYLCASLKIPVKRKRAPKGVSNKLTPEQQQYNKEVSKERIFVEHSIAQMKTFGCIQTRSRTKNKQLLNTLVAITAGIVNFKNNFVPDYQI